MNAAICIVVEGDIESNHGGISGWLYDLVAGLPAHHFHVVQIVADNIGRAPHRPRPSNMSTQHCLDCGLKSVSELRQWACTTRPAIPRYDLYHAVGAGHAAVLAQAISEQQGRPWILSEHASYGDELLVGEAFLESGRPVGTASRQVLLHTYAAIARQAYASAARTVALFEAFAQRQRRAGLAPERSRVIANGVRLPNTSPPPASTGHFDSLFWGRIAPIKRLPLLLEAVALAQQSIPQLRLTLAGASDPPCHRDRMVAHARGIGVEARWLPPQPRHNWPLQPDCLILTSQSEGQPLAILEAMARGVPVICSDTGGCRALVGDAGIVVDSTRPEHFTAALIRLAGDAGLASRLGRAGPPRIRQHFSLERMTNAYGALYQEVLVEADNDTKHLSLTATHRQGA